MFELCSSFIDHTDGDGDGKTPSSGCSSNHEERISKSHSEDIAPATAESGRYRKYHANIKENASPGTALLSLQLHQPTTKGGSDAIAPRQRRFDIVSGNGEGLFAIDHVTGNVTLRSSVDRERRPHHRLVIRSTPAGVSTSDDEWLAVVNIDVDDVNEYRPQFPVSLYRATLAVNQLRVGQNETFILTTRANDHDAGQFGTVEYRLESRSDVDGQGWTKFSIDRKSGDIRLDFSRSSTLLHHHQHPLKTEYNFTVVATDAEGWTDRADVMVIVVRRLSTTAATSRLYDASPRRFARNAYEFVVPGSAQSGHVVGSVGLVDTRGRPVIIKASDVTFTVRSRNSSWFDVDATSGVVMTTVDLRSAAAASGEYNAATGGARHRRQVKPGNAVPTSYDDLTTNFRFT